MYVEMKDICQQYGSFKASDHVSFGIEKGKLVALLGPSGSGKTTLLRMIAGLEIPNSGDIYIDGKRVNDVPASKRGIGFVFQNYALFRYMTVYDNVAFGLELQKVPKKEIKKRVMELLEITGLSGVEKRYPNQLSGGQRQRVAFARALAPRPQVLLLDEPFAAIDAKVRSELRLWLRSVVTKLGITSIFVTHDQDEAVEVADEIIITNHGTIEQLGTPAEIYNTPDTPFVAQFIGRSSLVEHYEELHGFDKIEGAAKAVIRPEFVKIHKFGKIDRYMSASQDGIVKDIVFRGNRLDVTVDVGGIEIICEWPLEKESLEIGEKVSLLIYRLYVLDKIIDSSGVTEDDFVLEIGPGIGTMTQYLCERAREVVAVEIDKNLIPILSDTLKNYSNVTVINEDILKLDICKLAEEKNQGKPIKVVANLPYYITTPIIMGLFESHVPIDSITIMVQKEVAERMQEGPGSKEYGALSLAVQYYARPEIVANVPPNCFMPRPNVGSAVIRLTRHEKPPVEVEDEKLMFRIIRASFNQRRKTLANGLNNSPEIHLPKEVIQESIVSLGVPENIRGEALSLEQFAELSNEIGQRMKQ